MTVKLAIVIAAIGLCLGGAVVSVSAHHAFAAEFDANKPVEFSGTVTQDGVDQPARLDTHEREEARRHASRSGRSRLGLRTCSSGGASRRRR